MSKLKNIYLIGFSGAGKTSVISFLKTYGNDVLDTDMEIARGSKLTTSEFFKQYGEDAFRREEAAVIKDASCKDGYIVSLGGGAVLLDDNIKLIKEGTIIWLDADVSVIASRIKGDMTRPLLDGKDECEIRKLKEVRDEIYNKLYDYKIDTSRLTVKEVCGKVMDIYESCNR